MIRRMTEDEKRRFAEAGAVRKQLRKGQVAGKYAELCRPGAVARIEGNLSSGISGGAILATGVLGLGARKQTGRLTFNIYQDGALVHSNAISPDQGSKVSSEKLRRYDKLVVNFNRMAAQGMTVD